MSDETPSQSRKRKTNGHEEILPKRARQNYSSPPDEDDMVNELVPGKIKRIFLKNFMCHSALEMIFNSKINFLVGINGSGKSAILTALTVGLGARAKDTDRGASLKGFVKQGKTSAVIEITITNRGDNAYQWETYGDTITVVRSIGAVSHYRIKSHTGETISTKKEELARIVIALNIQVDNPIAILNQDAARSFLMTKKPEDLYKFYMKATRLDMVGDNYRESVATSDFANNELRHANKYLRENEKVIADLQQKVTALESLDSYRQEYSELQNEISWAAVIEEEKKLLGVDKKIDHQNKEIEKLEGLESNKAAKEQEINSKIEEYKAQITNLEAEAAASQTKTEEMRKNVVKLRKIHDEKKTNLQKFVSTMKVKENDVEVLTAEIRKLEREESRADETREEFRQKLDHAEHQLDEVDATLRTKQTDLMHLEENNNRIHKEEKAIKIEIDSIKKNINQTRQSLLNCQSQPNDALALYGPDFSRLVRRIEEEHKRGRFQKKPIGPIGSYIRVKEKEWIPAVEAKIGGPLLKSFCVDNYRDNKILNTIMMEIFRNSPPQIITSRFFDQVHDVSRKCTHSSRYRSVFEMIEVTNTTALNTLIDQRRIERVVLIPTSKEACDVMSDYRNVPKNCEQAYTMACDLFYPDPNYKTYGGNANHRRILQVSTSEAIQRLEEELTEHQSRLVTHQEEYSKVLARKDQTQQEYSQVQKLVRSLQNKHREHKATIEECRDKLESTNNNVLLEHKKEVEEIQLWLERKKAEKAVLAAELRQHTTEMEQAMQDYKECKCLVTNVDTKLNPVKEKIRELIDEKKRLDNSIKGATKKLQEAKQVLQTLNVEHQQIQRAINAKTEIANSACPRIESTKSSAEINQRMKELSNFIRDVEKQHGDVETLKEELRERKGAYSEVEEAAINLQELTKINNDRIEVRKAEYNNMKREIAEKVQAAFANILLLRNYKGTVSVNHKTQRLDLEMIPINDAKRLTNNAKALSGGERSYSTIGFILALWHCTGLPFYFLDEFDVFMDKINRRMIIDILIHHAESSPNSQFTFLTPLDASHVKAKNSITIHRMAPPNRG